MARSSHVRESSNRREATILQDSTTAFEALELAPYPNLVRRLGRFKSGEAFQLSRPTLDQILLGEYDPRRDHEPVLQENQTELGIRIEIMALPKIMEDELAGVIMQRQLRAQRKQVTDVHGRASRRAERLEAEARGQGGRLGNLFGIGVPKFLEPVINAQQRCQKTYEAANLAISQIGLRRRSHFSLRQKKESRS